MRILEKLRVASVMALASMLLVCSCESGGESGGGDNPGPGPSGGTVETPVDDSLPVIPTITGTTYEVASGSAFNTAAGKVKAGDAIKLMDSGSWTNVSLTVSNDGTAEKPIVIMAETPGKVKLKGSSKMTLNGDYVYVTGLSFVEQKVSNSEFVRLNGNHVTISNCCFDGAGSVLSTTEIKKNTTTINVYGLNAVIEYNYFGNKTNMGMYMVIRCDEKAKTKNMVIRRNYFYRPHTNNNQQNTQEVMRIGGDGCGPDFACKTLLEGNFFYKCNGEIEIVSLKSGHNTVKHNTFYECAGTLCVRSGFYNTIEGNYFLANGAAGAGGIRVTGTGNRIFNNYFNKQTLGSSRSGIVLHQGYDNPPSGYHQCKNTEIYNNTFVDGSTAIYVGYGVSATDGYDAPLLPPYNTKIGGNVIVTGYRGTTQSNLFTFDNGAKESDLILDSNDIFATNSDPAGTIHEEFQDETMTIAGMSIRKIISNSEYGTAPDYLTRDISGVQRSSDTSLGAMVASFASSTPAPSVATPTNCGPTWKGWTKPLQ